MSDESLGLVNATNARDLGGYPTADGRSVRRGVLFRANALNRLTEADVAAVGRLGLACVIDFRHPHEIELIGPDRLPTPAPGRLVALPLYDPEHDVFTAVTAALRGTVDATSLARLSAGYDGGNAEHDGGHAGYDGGNAGYDTGGGATVMLEIYRWFVTEPVARRTFAAALRLIASADALPLLFHCSAGKDRTGWLSALVLSALGVDRAVIIEDYLRTNDMNATGRGYMLSRMSDRMEDPAVLIPLLEARQEYLEEAFAEVDRAYGGLHGYVRDGLGIDDATLAALRANLLE